MHGDVRIGSWLVRAQLNTIANGEQEIRLEPKAMAVLALLVERPGDVVSREEILSRIWNGRFVSDEVLTNVVSQLRRALGDDPKSPRFIQTIAKNGYRLIAPVTTLPANKHSFRAGWAVAALLLAGTAALTSSGFRDGRATDGTEPSSSLIVHVDEFESLSNDGKLDWLRTGIADLMVTGLSQTPRLYVVGPAQREGASTTTKGNVVVVSGTFAQIGERFRVDARATDARSGEVVAADSVLGTSPSELFELVDELAARMALRLDVVRDAEPHLNRALADVTTSSLDAYRHYVDGMRRYYYDLDHHAALKAYQNAVSIDPAFGMAYAKMAIVHMNLGDYPAANEAARRAIDHAERMPEIERHYVTGNFYVTREETYSRALEAYRAALRVDERHLAARHNIAFIYFRLERYREAIDELEELVRRGVRFPGSYRLLMLCYAALDEFEEGRRVAQLYLARHPEKWIGYRNLGQHLMRWGRLSEANEALFRADALRPGTLEPNDWWQLKLLRDEPAPVASELRPWPSSAPPLGPAMERLYAGRPSEALHALDEAMSSDPGGDWAPVALNAAATIHLQTGNDDESLRAARRAAERGPGNPFEWNALSIAARASAGAGDWNEAERLLRELERKTASIPSQKEHRRAHHLRGELALLRGNAEEAIRALETAEILLPPRGFPVTTQMPQHVPIRFALAEAYRAAGMPHAAKKWYERVTESTTERLVWPVLFVRSFYQLGTLQDETGEPEKARESFRRFLGFWEDGRLDREEVRTAKDRVAAYDASR